MNENIENKSSRLLAILDSLNRQIETLKNNEENSNNLAEYEQQKKEILSKIEFVERCIKIGIIKKTDSMSRQELLDIALKSLSVVSEDINPNDFISEYNRLKRYRAEYIEDVSKRRSIIPELTFTVEGKLDTLVDKNGKPRSNFEIVPEDQERVNKFLKMRRKLGNIRLKVKVPSDYFSDEELYEMGYKKLSESDSYLMKGFTVKTPDDYTLNPGEPNIEHPFQHFTISSDAVASKKLSSRYNIYDYEDCKAQMKRMEIILPEIQLKQNLLSDSGYLKEYVQRLLTNDPEFIDDYLTDKEMGTKVSIENQHLYQDSITDLSDDYINQILTSLSDVSDEHLREMFDTTDKIDTYMKVLESIKRKARRNFPKIYIEPLDRSEEVKQFIKDRIGTIFHDYNDGLGRARVSASPEFFTEEDITLFEQGQPINKNIDGRDIQFQFDPTRYGKTSSYYNDELKTRPEYKEKLMEVFDEYRNSLVNGYPTELQKIAECDKKIAVLNNLREQYTNPSMSEPTSYGAPRHN
jgi:hypothetical protein